MPELNVLDHTGDTRVEWDPADPESVKIAKAAFKKGREKGHLAYRDNGGDDREQIRKFDPTAGRIVLVPQTVGG